MNLLIIVFAFVFALGPIVFIHEAGHYLVAKFFDVRILTFSLGFGHRVFGFQRGETEYRVSWIPLGGYVRMGGEEPGEISEDPRDFQNKPRWQRILVYLAGPIANAVLAVVLIALVFMGGLDVPNLDSIPPLVGTVVEGSPAERAGILPGDEVVEIDGKEVDSWQDVAMTVMESPGRAIPWISERDGRRMTFELVPDTVSKYEFGDAGVYPRILPRISLVQAESPAAAAGFVVGDEIRAVDGRGLGSPGDFVDYIEAHAGDPVEVEVLRQQEKVLVIVTPGLVDGVGRIGVGLTVSRKLGPMDAFRESVRYNWNVIEQTVSLVGKLFRGRVKPQSALSGPIEIASMSGEAARQGPSSFFHLMGLLSISIGFLNLFPIPILDGGQILVLLVESVMRRDLSMRLKEAVNMVGLVLVVLLMAFVLFVDASRNEWFGGSKSDEASTEPAADIAPVAD
ncbi:MAG: RIP metalloprotease RseP [Thermoanaerobaculia bacterium]|nr:RIP metalloprotease RseP [Thermoanaerobaculia bacterium]